jgi:hypothetical protein
MTKYFFDIELEHSKVFQCYREVVGLVSLGIISQVIHVKGIGIQEDKIIYGDSVNSVTEMEHNAKLIALEIIKTRGKI